MNDLVVRLSQGLKMFLDQTVNWYLSNFFIGPSHRDNEPFFPENVRVQKQNLISRYVLGVYYYSLIFLIFCIYIYIICKCVFMWQLFQKRTQFVMHIFLG